MAKNLADGFKYNAVHRGSRYIRDQVDRESLYYSVGVQNFRRSKLGDTINLAPVIPPRSVVLSPAHCGAPSTDIPLLLVCCRASDRLAAESIAPADWDRIVATAEHHGLIPHLYRTLGTATGPELDLNKLRKRVEANTRQTLWLAHQLIRTVEGLESRGIQALAYKGPALAQLLYGDISMRQFSDIDLIVAREDVPRAKAVVLELGYRLPTKLTGREERAYLASGYEYTFDSSDARNLLEIQWRILPGYYALEFDISRFFRRSVSVHIGGKEVGTLCAEDLLLVLCAHAAKHAWSKVSWIMEIADLAETRDLDWSTVAEQASRLRMKRIVAITFRLAESLLARTVPEAVLRHFPCGPEALAVADEIFSRISSCDDYNTESIAYFQFVMRTRESWHDRARCFTRLAFTPGTGEWSAVRLPGVLFPGYRLVRMFRLAKRLASGKF